MIGIGPIETLRFATLSMDAPAGLVPEMKAAPWDWRAPPAARSSAITVPS